ncbi:C39 family peptidase [Sulfobacillus harzensis]|uniref:Peptidase C39-like domain-containing protein n=1 Tax=Sulfobacillus harzensis TaxID=2729629 RepID=A0A7Y0L2F8_9FIRM|nr:C39 family peptidase [Sulfobacillus harzensis]NMP22064.1 hypothetical protein [Sulfobacillus harzensis]
MGRRRRRVRPRWGGLVIGILLVAGGYMVSHRLFSAPRPAVRTGLPAIGHKPKPPKRSVAPSHRSAPMPSHALIHVVGIDQYPQLPNGCEVTSLTMLMDAVGHPVSKMTLAAEMPKDPTKLVLDTTTNASGQTVHHVQYWGNPNIGFVGSVYQAGEGYGIYHGPMTKFLNQLLPGQAEDLTGSSFHTILQHVAAGIPVEVWTTITFKPTTDWVTWQSPEGPVKATPLEHAVLLVGYGPGVLYVNNPLNGEAAEKIPEAPFLQSWDQLGKQAITVKLPASGTR